MAVVEQAKVEADDDDWACFLGVAVENHVVAPRHKRVEVVADLNPAL